ncbi:MAG: type IV pilus secretin PilQ [Pseudomonadota bacterium]
MISRYLNIGYVKGKLAMKTLKKYFMQIISLASFTFFSLHAYAVSLDDVSFASLPGDRVQIKLMLSEPLAAEPLNFTIDNPARIALDFPNVDMNLTDKSQTIGIGMANSINAVEAAGRTRVVINLTRSVPYDLAIEGNSVVLNLESGASSVEQSVSSTNYSSTNSLQNVDFRRGDNGEGRVIVELSDPSVPVDLGFESGKIVIDYLDTQLPSNLDRKLDVIDFATPVKEIDTKASGNNVRMTITTVTEDYEHLAYQSENTYTIEFKPLSQDELEAQKRDKFQYTGERLSLNFQNIEVRAVLQLIADFTGLNMVTSDSVGGNVTLRLKNVPWDQALDIILRSRGLGMRQDGNVIMVAPQEELAAREQLELESERAIEELAPLRTEFIQVNYADANNLIGLIQAEENNLLSERGNVSIDERTNTIIIQDVATSLDSIRGLVTELDVPVKQVLIESRIVNADESFAKDVGVRFGYSKTTGLVRRDEEAPGFVLGGKQPGDVEYAAGTAFTTDDNENYIVDLPAVPTDASAIALAVGKIGSYLLQLELSALIAEGRGEDIASPRVITANQTEAVIESGVQIPYQEASSSGATSVSFQDAVLSLRVTPQITPDDTIIMDLQVTQDTVSSTTVLGVPAINTRNVATQVLVDNGETVVLGGVYSSTDRKSIDRTPFFGDLPYVGFLFKRTAVDTSKSELLIFITPKILKDNLAI